MTLQKTCTVYVAILEEGSDAWRGTDAIDLGNGLYQLLATPYYDPEDEIWEFVPGTIVRARLVQNTKGINLLLAYEMVSPPQ